MNMVNLKRWLFLVFMLPVISSAEIYTNGEQGYSIEIGDKYRVIRDYGLTYFESAESDNTVMVRNWPGLTEQIAKDYLLEGYQDDRIAVVATSSVKELEAENGTGVWVDVVGIFDRQLVKGIAAGLIGDDGQGIVLLAAAAEKDWDGFASEAKDIAASVKFIERRAGPDARDWYYMLSGKRLSLWDDANDGRRREDLYLCSDGSFQHRIAKSEISESDTGSSFGHSTRTRNGSWKVVDKDEDSYLMLLYGEGFEESAIIEYRDGLILIDGRRYAIKKNNRCR